MSGDDEIEKPKYPLATKQEGTLPGNMGYPPERQVKYSPMDITPSFIEQMKADAIAFKEQRELDNMTYLARQLLSPFIGCQGYFEYPTPSVTKVLKKAISWGINQRSQEIEMVVFEIEKIKEAKKASAATFTKEKIEAALWKYKPLEIVTKSEGRTHMFYPNTIEEANEMVALEVERQQIFDARLAYFAAIKAGYEAQQREMEKAAPNILKQKLGEIRQVVEDAERTINKVRKTAHQNQKTHDVKGKDAVKFMDEREKFTQLQARYIQLTAEIRNYASPDLSLLPFPDNLMLDALVSTAEIEQAAETERKGIKNYPIFTA